jgi:AraC-like DNA-binding protein
MYATILLSASIQGFLLSLALFLKKSKNRLSGIYLSLILIVFSIELLFSWGGITGYNNHRGIFPYWVLLSYLIVPSSLWLFFKHNTETHFKFSKKHLLLFLPAFIQMLVEIVSFYGRGNSIVEGLNKITNSDGWFVFIEVVPLFFTIIVLIMQGSKLIAVHRQFKGNRNPSLHFHLLKMDIVFAAFCLIVLIWAAMTLLNLQLIKFVEVLFTTILFSLAYIAFFKPEFYEIPKVLQSNITDPFKNYNDDTEFTRVISLFENSKVYARSKLSVTEVAAELGLPVKYVSYLVNKHAGSNFTDFVNGYRVKEILRKIPSEKNKTLLGIAMEAGFNSKSAFNQAFKHHTGKSPSEYLE